LSRRRSRVPAREQLRPKACERSVLRSCSAGGRRRARFGSIRAGAPSLSDVLDDQRSSSARGEGSRLFASSWPALEAASRRPTMRTWLRILDFAARAWRRPPPIAGHVRCSAREGVVRLAASRLARPWRAFPYLQALRRRHGLDEPVSRGLRLVRETLPAHARLHPRMRARRAARSAALRPARSVSTRPLFMRARASESTQGPTHGTTDRARRA
jgi:hypothetical protein